MMKKMDARGLGDRPNRVEPVSKQSVAIDSIRQNSLSTSNRVEPVSKQSVAEGLRTRQPDLPKTRADVGCGDPPLLRSETDR